jgi:hypothetical protein
MKDTITLYNIYKDYLVTTVKLIELLEKHTQKASKNNARALTGKYQEFADHAHNLIVCFNEDLHKLLRINQELKELINGKH